MSRRGSGSLSLPMDPGEGCKSLTQEPKGGAQTGIQLQAQIMRQQKEIKGGGRMVALSDSPPCAHESNMRSTVRNRA